MVDVEQRALRAFEQQVLAFLLEREQVARDIAHHGREGRRQGHGLIAHFVGRHGLGAQVLGQHEVVVIEHLGQLLVEQRRVEEVLHPQARRATLSS